MALLQLDMDGTRGAVVGLQTWPIVASKAMKQAKKILERPFQFREVPLEVCTVSQEPL